MTDKEAIEALTDKDVVNPYLTLEALEIAIDALKERAERKTGRWIRRHSKMWECSECERGCRWRENYCPDCGAKMEIDE